MAKHTPTPWSMECPALPVGSRKRPSFEIVYRSATIATVRDEADAVLIVRVVNAHDALVAALEAFLRAPSVGSDGPGSTTIVVQDFNLRAARAALALALPPV